MFDIQPVGKNAVAEIQRKIDQKTKPPGALGQLEDLALQLASIQGKEKIEISHPRLLVFAGDHGIAEENISIAGSEVTRQMVLNFLSGGAAINCFCRSNGIPLEVVDTGIIVPIESNDLIQQSLGRGTRNFSQTPAMSEQVVRQGLTLGANLVASRQQSGSNLFAFGEMGIGNTSSAAAVMSALTGIDIEECVGRGTGINHEQFANKQKLLAQALSQYDIDKSDPYQVLATFGGFEIVQMTGAILAAAANRSVVLVDGFIATVAALVAVKIQPETRGYLVFCHESAEQGHQRLLAYLNAQPLLGLGLRLGEGTGAALALPLVKAAMVFYNDMASFESAGVTAV